MKNIVTIPSNLSVCPWVQKILNKFIESKIFEIKYEKFPEISLSSIVGRRHSNIGFFKFNDVLMGIDVWDGCHPTSQLTDWFLKNDFYIKTKIIFKIQYRNSVEIQSLKEFTLKTGIKINNWTMFHSEMFPLEYFKWDCKKKHKYITYISGKRRQNWIDFFKDSNEIATYENCGLNKANKGKQKLIRDDFFSILKDCRWGLSLKGKRLGNMDCKNRREVEYSSLGMPMILNYIPEYPFPFYPNDHYVYIDSPKDLLSIKDIDPYPYAKKSLDIYNDYFSGLGSSKLFIKLVEEMV
jgi:hypothetical protein